MCVCDLFRGLNPAFWCSTRMRLVGSCVLLHSLSLFLANMHFLSPPPSPRCVWVVLCVAAFFSIHTLSAISLSLVHIYTNPPSSYAGGSVTAGLGIYDTMQYVQPPVATWCVGQACSMGAFLLAAGAWGMRHCLPHSRVMIHQPHGTAGVSVGARETLRATEEECNFLLVKYWHIGFFLHRVKPLTLLFKLRRSWSWREHWMSSCLCTQDSHWLLLVRWPSAYYRTTVRPSLILWRPSLPFLSPHSSEQATERDKFMSPQEAKDFGIVDQVLHHGRPLASSQQ